MEFLYGAGASSRDLDSPDLGERIIRMFESADELERETMAVNKKPLETALRKIGVSASVEDTGRGWCELVFDDNEAYREAVRAIFQPDAMHTLAEAGWIPTHEGDVAMSGEPAVYKIGFFEIDVAGGEMSDKETVPDPKKVAKDSQADASEEMNREDELNPVENPDAEMGDAQEGVGKASDGKDPEGKPKGSSKNESQAASHPGRRKIDEGASAKQVAERLLEATTTGAVPPVSEPPLATMRPPQNRPERLKKRRVPQKPKKA